jgi:hypothetical protein
VWRGEERAEEKISSRSRRKKKCGESRANQRVTCGHHQTNSLDYISTSTLGSSKVINISKY